VRSDGAIVVAGIAAADTPWSGLEEDEETTGIVVASFDALLEPRWVMSFPTDDEDAPVFVSWDFGDCVYVAGAFADGAVVRRLCEELVFGP